MKSEDKICAVSKKKKMSESVHYGQTCSGHFGGIVVPLLKQINACVACSMGTLACFFIISKPTLQVLYSFIAQVS